MQSLREIRELLSQAQLQPNRRLGQCFLFDQNLMGKLLELAEIDRDVTVVEVGPGTGSLTEELLDRTPKVVAVEIDRGLARLVAEKFAHRDGFRLIAEDALAGKHALNPRLVAEAAPRAHLVANLPYNIATPLLVEMLLATRRSEMPAAEPSTRFERMTFTVQREVADRLCAQAGDKNYGPVSVLVQALSRAQPGPVLPASAFWPRPKIASRIVRLDYDPSLAAQVADPELLRGVVSGLFAQRRKQVGKLARKLGDTDPRLAGAPEALRAAGVGPTARAEQIPPQVYVDIAARLGGR
jgi:16S rRNA (adenine1518-N6/adenine1519-N6)-dimethyltransferase